MLDPALARFNDLVREQAEEELLACCAVPEWAARVALGRPYPSVGSLTALGLEALADLSWDQVAQALAAHPRIGERAAGGSREAAWSRREQGDAAEAPEAAALHEANVAYEERFGHVFLIFASGRTPAEMLAAARARLGNDEQTERRVVRAELARIVRLRLERLVG
ncbi:2-oxo-4-hydroxy-4-carboxy-5-ureidoimidazoline decarboxylase [Luedemannella helvata]|uniref:2-oxo-4-hydroxy-4-carboxy-5-ureidoimidazoline decarboxylase n=1 Tax=Luedemannella helvata TaxID=349315 RepID=A0ABN2JXI6_9ACTN